MLFDAALCHKYPLVFTEISQKGTKYVFPSEKKY